LVAAPAVAQDALTLPSGSLATPLDLIVEEGVQRARFIASGLATDASDHQSDPLRLFEDMRFLCQTVVKTAPPPPDMQIIVTLMDHPLEFGTIDPTVTQFFEAFAIRAGVCVLDEGEFLD